MDKEKNGEKMALVLARMTEMQGIRVGFYTNFLGLRIPSKKVAWKGERDDREKHCLSV